MRWTSKRSWNAGRSAATMRSQPAPCRLGITTASRARAIDLEHQVGGDAGPAAGVAMVTATGQLTEHRRESQERLPRHGGARVKMGGLGLEARESAGAWA